MKKKTAFLLMSLVFAYGLQASAWVATPSTEKEYRFVFRLNNETYTTELKSNTYEQAFEKAATECFQHFKGGRRISEDRGLSIIDVCANPRTM